ncbi:MAG: translocation/assembly module TamB domain-containing protein [Bacteroidota bacterium]
MTLRRRIAIYLRYIGLAILGLFLLLWTLLQFPAVQTYTTQKITQILSENLDTKVHIEGVDIDFFKTIALEDIYIEDQQQDTLLFAKRLSADIGLFSLFQKNISLNNIGLNGAKVNLHRTAIDSTFNYEFIVNHFQSTDTQPTDTATAWTFSLAAVHVERSQLQYIDEVTKLETDLFLSRFDITINELDLVAQKANIEEVLLENSSVEIRTRNQPQSLNSTVKNQAATFPDLGWDLSLESLKIIDQTVVFDNLDATKMTAGVDFQHLDLSDFTLIAEDLEWSEKNMQVDINRLAFAEKSGFILRNLSVEIEADSQQISLKDWTIISPESRLTNTTQLTYPTFSDLLTFNDEVSFSTDFDNLNVAFSDLRLFAPTLTEIKQLNTNLSESIYFDGVIRGTLADIRLENLDFNVGNKVALRLDGKVTNVTQLEQAFFDVRLKELSTSYQKIARLTDSLQLPTGLSTFGQFKLSGRVKGTVDSLYLKNFYLNTASNTFLKADMQLSDLMNREKLAFDANIQRIETKATDWKGFLRDTVPPVLDSLENIVYVGKAVGNLQKVALKGDLSTSIGKLVSDLKIEFTPDYSSGTYEGDLQLINFQLDKAFPQNAALGTASLQAKGKGNGFDLDSLIADAQIIIDSIQYNDYTYEDILIDGSMVQKDFNGTIVLEDEHANLDFEGRINLKDSIPDFQFVLNLDTLNLQLLNFTEEPLAFQLKADIDFRGNDLDNIEGQSVFSNFSITNGIDEYEEDSLFFTATQPNADSAYLNWQSDFLEIEMAGDFDIAKLAGVTINYINDFFPLDNLLDTLRRTELRTLANEQQSFDFNIQISDPTPLTLLFVPQLTRLEDAEINGSFDRKKQQLDLEAIVDNLTLGGLEADQLVWSIGGQEERLTSNLALLQAEIGGLFAPLAILETNLGEDSLRLQINVTGDTLENRLALKVVAYQSEEFYQFKFYDRLFLNGEEWKVNPKNKGYFLNNYLFIDQLDFQEKNHKIAIQSTGEPPATKSTPTLNITFQNFEIADITNFLAINQNRIKGQINGTFALKEPFDNAHYVADLKVHDLVLNGERVGQFYVDSEQTANREIIQLTTGLVGKENRLKIDGQYYIQERRFDLTGDIQEMEMRLLNPFTEGIISDSKGKLAGQFTLVGTPEQPNLNGAISLNQASTIIDFLGTRILIPQHTIELNNGAIQLGSVEVKDIDNQTGTLSGKIRHDFFSNFFLDLDFSTPSFQVMNTKAEDNPLFFGRLIVAADVAINGSLDLPSIELNARTLPKSVFNLQPLVESEQIVTDDYILFTTPEDYAESSTDTESQRYELENTFNLNLLMNVNVTPDALLKVIIDPLTGDQIEGRGRSDMTISLNPAGDFRILGDYVIDQGQYNFSYQNLVKKNFTIQSGSQVRFLGDPLQARFDITALYSVKTSTYDLIRNETNFENSAELSAARRRTEVDALLYLDGLFTKPTINFDIRLADGLDNDINSTVSRKLNDLRNDPDEMNKQVFSLLLFNSFIASENAGESLSGVGQDIALSSVSKLLSNQLNQLADKYLDGLELSFDLASYQSNFEDAAGPAVELGVGVSQKLFNDRITIKADADFNLANQSTAAGQNIAGDFVLEYQLTEQGNYLLRVFHISDFDVLTDQNTAKTGVGINFRKSFGNVLKRKQ